jgi:hypothetical protein
MSIPLRSARATFELMCTLLKAPNKARDNLHLNLASNGCIKNARKSSEYAEG